MSTIVKPVLFSYLVNAKDSSFTPVEGTFRGFTEEGGLEFDMVDPAKPWVTVTYEGNAIEFFSTAAERDAAIARASALTAKLMGLFVKPAAKPATKPAAKVTKVPAKPVPVKVTAKPKSGKKTA